MKPFCLFLLLVACHFSVAQSSSLPVVSVLPFAGNGSDMAKSAVSAGLTNSRRIRIVDRRTLDNVINEQRITTSEVFKDNNVIVRTGQLTGAQYVLEGTITAINYGNERSGELYYNTCSVTVELKLTDIETGLSESDVLSGGVRSTTQSGQQLESSAFTTLTTQAELFARKRFPATMQILEVLETSDRKGVVSFRVEGEGLKANRPSSSELTLVSIFASGRTQIRISSPREVVRADGTKRMIFEQVATAKIKQVEEGGTAICTVSDGGKKLQELWEKKAALALKTID